MKHADVIIAPVGKQPMPILIPLLQFAPVSGQLIVTEDVAEVADYLRAVARDNPKVPQPWPHGPVNPYEAQQTFELCRDILHKRRFAGKNFAINISGGTTLMAMGAQWAAKEFEVPMLYVDTDDGVIVHLSPDGQTVQEERIIVNVSAEVYLMAHGAFASSREPWGERVASDDPDLARFHAAAKVLGEAGSHSQRLLDQIRAGYNRADRMVSQGRPSDAEEELIDELSRQRLITDIHTDNGTAGFHLVDETLTRQFLEGHWLELYVYDACVDSELFDDVRISVDVKRPAEPETVVNELDIIVTRRGRLAAISCKTGKEMTPGGGKTEREKRQQAVYELDSLLQADLMGLYARKLLISNRVELAPAIRSRASHSQIRCVSGGELPDVAGIIKDHLKT